MEISDFHRKVLTTIAAPNYLGSSPTGQTGATDGNQLAELSARTANLEAKSKPAHLVLNQISKPSQETASGEWIQNIDIVPDKNGTVENPFVSLKFLHAYRKVTLKVVPEQLGSVVFSLFVTENPEKTEYSLSFSELPRGRWLRFIVARTERHVGDVNVVLER